MKYNWRKDAKKEDIKKHVQSLEAAINYYRHRLNPEKVAEIEHELNDLKAFYNLK